MITVTVLRGHTFTEGLPLTTADLNAAALPTVAVDGLVGAADIDDESVKVRHTSPGAYFYKLSTGSANAYEVALDPGAASLDVGLWFSFKAHAANTAATTVSVNGLTAKALTLSNGEAMRGGEIVQGQICWVQYDGTQFRLISDPAMPRTLYAVDIGVANAYSVALPGISITSLDQLLGQEIIFKATAANTGASTLVVNGLAAKAITKQGATALSAADIQTGGLVSVAYDGAQFQMTSFVAAPSLPSVGAVGTKLYPYSITVDAQGRVTGAAPGLYTSAAVALPAKGSAQTFTHGLGRTPIGVRAVLVMGATPEAGFAEGDELELWSVYGGPVPDEPTTFSVCANGTSITVARLNDSEYVTGKNGSQFTFTGSLWTLKVYAW